MRRSDYFTVQPLTERAPALSCSEGTFSSKPIPGRPLGVSAKLTEQLPGASEIGKGDFEEPRTLRLSMNAQVSKIRMACPRPRLHLSNPGGGGGSSFQSSIPDTFPMSLPKIAASLHTENRNRNILSERHLHEPDPCQVSHLRWESSPH